MPRQARLDAPGTLHHVMVRGIERTSIFRDDTDREAFLARLPPLAALRSRRRTPAIRRAQHLLCQPAIRHLRYPGAVVARFLGVTTSAANRAAWPPPAPGVTELL